LSGAGVLLKDFKRWSQELTDQIRQACEGVMSDAARPNLYLNSSSVSKEELAEKIRVRDGIQSRSHPAWKTALELEGRPLEYYWSLEQSEWASDLMFRDEASLKEVYPKLLRHGITALSCDSVMRFLGRGYNAAFKGQVQSDLRRRSEGVRVKHSLNGNSVKMYDKQGSVLRIETTIHNPRDLKVWRGTEAEPEKKRWRPLRKGVADLHRRAQISQGSNERYMEAMSLANLDKTVSELIEPVCRRVNKGGKGHRALRPMHEPDMNLLKAVSDGRWTINGFRNKDIREILLGSDPGNARECKKRSGQITRRLALLHAHGLIKKVSGTRRWLMTAKGRQIATLLQATQIVPSQTLLAAA